MSKTLKRSNSFVSQVVEKIVADKKIRLFVDQNKDPYIAPNGDGTEVYELDSQDAMDWLLGYVMDHFNNAVLVRDEPKNIIDNLRGYAKVRGLGNMRLELRTAMDDDNNIWYDLGSGAVKITPDGWEFVPQPPILFMRNYSQQNQVLPEKGGDIWELFDYINVKDDKDRLLLISFLVASEVPGINKPILAISGPAGSGKSECTKTLKMLMDPTTPPSMPPITSVDELNKLALTSSTMAFDNLSSMKNSVADQFCRLATGTGVRIRKLYKTNEYIIFEAIRPIIVNGISQIITQSDLLNRTIPIELSPIEKRITDDELRRKFSEARPRLFGAMLDLLAGAMKVYPTISRTNWPRMGAFARWGYAVCEAAGGESSGEKFMDAYAKAERVQHREALHASPFSLAVEWFMQNKDIWAGSCGELLDAVAYDDNPTKHMPVELKYLSRSSFWPTNTRAASVNLRKNVADFVSRGILVVPPTGDSRTFHIINTNLPVRRVIEQDMLDLLVPDIPEGADPNTATYRNLGYTVEDLVKIHPYAIDSEYLDKSSEEPRLIKQVLSGEVIPKIKEKPADRLDDIADQEYTKIVQHMGHKFHVINDWRGGADPLAGAEEITAEDIPF